MYESFCSVVGQIDSLVWGWPMIILLIGTHIFMTIRTKGIQRKLGTAIKLSISSELSRTRLRSSD